MSLTIRACRRLKAICLYGSIAIIFTSNVFNYFYSYRYLDDDDLQWTIAKFSIASVMFLMSCYLWLSETVKKNSFGIIISGWAALYLLFNLIGVAAGYTLHTKGFMAILFTITLSGIGHLGIRLWQRYFL